MQWPALTRAGLFVFALPCFGQSWAYWASVDGYFTPDQNYATLTAMADRDRLHLETRYNYEGQHTASLWAGYNIQHVTLMLGGVFGDTKGIAPGVEVTAAWRKFDFYTEGEYLFASGEDDFVYFWSELAYSPAKWLRAGIAAQRTRTFDMGVDVQRGLLVGLKFRRFSLTTSVFEPGSNNQTVVVTAATDF